LARRWTPRVNLSTRKLRATAPSGSRIMVCRLRRFRPRRFSAKSLVSGWECNVRRKATARIRGRALAFAFLSSFAPCALASAAEISQPQSLEDRLEAPGGNDALATRFRMRGRRSRDGDSPATEADSGDAKRFSARLKHRQLRHFSKKRREFRKQQLRLETQRRFRRARIRARAFAAARRRAASQHASGSRRRTNDHRKEISMKRPGGAR